MSEFKEFKKKNEIFFNHSLHLSSDSKNKPSISVSSKSWEVSSKHFSGKNVHIFNKKKKQRNIFKEN